MASLNYSCRFPSSLTDVSDVNETHTSAASVQQRNQQLTDWLSLVYLWCLKAALWLVLPTNSYWTHYELKQPSISTRPHKALNLIVRYSVGLLSVHFVFQHHLLYITFIYDVCGVWTMESASCLLSLAALIKSITTCLWLLWFTLRLPGVTRGQ